MAGLLFSSIGIVVQGGFVIGVRSAWTPSWYDHHGARHRRAGRAGELVAVADGAAAVDGAGTRPKSLQERVCETTSGWTVISTASAGSRRIPKGTLESRDVHQSSILSMLHGRASLRPGDVAYTFTDYVHDPAGVPESLTWSQLSRRTLNVAHEISGCHGSVGDRAVILAPQGLDYILAFLGVHAGRARRGSASVAPSRLESRRGERGPSPIRSPRSFSRRPRPPKTSAITSISHVWTRRRRSSRSIR